ncbi:hypothetical protein CCM_03504 [Cordyceps militaris CM01]|uniref:Uncharacterized protein n=1 Tax=Cordyceps militaris (strain CM01) TaxID=983644 RepID=G3JB20_CORMM|nr:uncharacterized protein CCM_03504 [Cordyceps militaris CM01]EGX95232.1 hypothetical protein CCM_03504 [Cordyceps militaris CM01]
MSTCKLLLISAPRFMQSGIIPNVDLFQCQNDDPTDKRTMGSRYTITCVSGLSTAVRPNHGNVLVPWTRRARHWRASRRPVASDAPPLSLPGLTKLGKPAC